VHTDTPTWRLSEFEEHWQRGQPRMRPASRRASAYDPAHVMFYFPMVSTHEPIGPLVSDIPTDEWVAVAFEDFVRGEARPPPHPCVGRLDDRGLDRDDTSAVDELGLLSTYLAECERQLVYGGILDKLLNDRSLSDGAKIFRVLAHELLGNTDNLRHPTHAELDTKLASARAAGLPLQFVLPAFPFKDQNPFRTAAPADHVDAGEVALLIRLHLLALAVWRVYPYGAEWLILSDGVAYAPIFGVPLQEARRYQMKLREYRTRLNLSKTVHLVDLADATQRLGELGSNGHSEGLTFAAIVEDIDYKLRTLTRIDRNTRARFDVLRRGMKWNVETRTLLDHYDPAAVWAAVTHAGRPPTRGRTQEVFDIVHDRAERAAYQYAAFSLAARHVRLFEVLFPGTIRGTVNPKPNQIAIPRLGSVYPWNGTATLTSGTVGPRSIESAPLYRILSRGAVRPRYGLGGRGPFFYESTD
jgi:pyoverdine/dityrosine biosynthesis protein